MQNRRNSIADVLRLCLFWNKSSICYTVPRSCYLYNENPIPGILERCIDKNKPDTCPKGRSHTSIIWNAPRKLMQLAPSSSLNNTGAIFPKYNCSSTSSENSLEYIIHANNSWQDCDERYHSDDILSTLTSVSPIDTFYKYKQQNKKSSRE